MLIFGRSPLVDSVSSGEVDKNSLQGGIRSANKPRLCAAPEPAIPGNSDRATNFRLRRIEVMFATMQARECKHHGARSRHARRYSSGVLYIPSVIYPESRLRNKRSDRHSRYARHATKNLQLPHKRNNRSHRCNPKKEIRPTPLGSRRGCMQSTRHDLEVRMEHLCYGPSSDSRSRSSC